MSFSPVVTSSTLAKNEVVRTEELTERSRTNRIHGAGLQVNQNGTRDVLATAGFVVVNIDTLQLQLGFAMIGTVWLDAVFIGNDLPKLQNSNKKLRICGMTSR